MSMNVRLQKYLRQLYIFFSSRRRHTRLQGDWSSDVCSSDLAALGKRDVLIVSYGMLVRDVEQLAAHTFGTLVLDEAQALKNPQTRRAKAARSLDEIGRASSRERG